MHNSSLQNLFSLNNKVGNNDKASLVHVSSGGHQDFADILSGIQSNRMGTHSSPPNFGNELRQSESNSQIPLSAILNRQDSRMSDEEL